MQRADCFPGEDIAALAEEAARGGEPDWAALHRVVGRQGAMARLALEKLAPHYTGRCMDKPAAEQDWGPLLELADYVPSLVPLYISMLCGGAYWLTDYVKPKLLLKHLVSRDETPAAKMLGPLEHLYSEGQRMDDEDQVMRMVMEMVQDYDYGEPHAAGMLQFLFGEHEIDFGLWDGLTLLDEEDLDILKRARELYHNGLSPSAEAKPNL